MSTHLLRLLLLAAPMILAACISSEETGGTGRASTPQPILAKADTQRINRLPGRPATDTSKRLAKMDSTKLRIVRRAIPTLKTKKDTVQAALVTRSKSANRSAREGSSSSSMYTVQVGAFKSASNALRVQKAAKQRYGDEPVFNKYASSKKLYRVTIGKFRERRNANRLREQMMKDHPKEYAQCWVNYLQ